MEIEKEVRERHRPRVCAKVFLAAFLCAVGFAPLFVHTTSADAEADVEAGAEAGAASCEGVDSTTVPGAERQDEYCLEDLTTEGTQPAGRTNRNDWEGLNASGTENPPGEVPGIQIDGYFPDDTDNGNNNPNNGYLHNAQFVIRMPDDWNGKVVITGAPGVRGQYANDFIISDYVLSKGYAFAATDKGNVGANFYRDGEEPGDAVAEWHRRVEELTLATKNVVEQKYGKAPERTYITGVSNGGYLTRYALENTPELYDGGVDWEGTLFREEGPNLFTYLPDALANYPEYAATGDEEAFRNIVEAGFAPGSEFLWRDYYAIYWDLTQRVYREEFDPEYDGELEAGVPFCQPGTPNCDADYDYESRPDSVKEAVGKVSNTGDIGKPMITLHGTLDTLLPIKTDSDVYEKLVADSGKEDIHRYYPVEDGDHVDSFYDDHPDKLRPILPCHRTAFEALEAWVEEGDAPPESQTIENPGSGDVVNECGLEEDDPPENPDPPKPDPPKPDPKPDPNACTIRGTKGNDNLRGTPRRDVICGFGGNDIIRGLGGNDRIVGSPGNDILYGGNGNDTIVGGSGRDILKGEGGNDRLDARDGARGNDIADGGPGRDGCFVDPRDVRRGCP